MTNTVRFVACVAMVACFGCSDPEPCDFNSNGVVDQVDLDLLTDQLYTDANEFDMNGDGKVNGIDYTICLKRVTPK